MPDADGERGQSLWSAYVKAHFPGAVDIQSLTPSQQLAVKAACYKLAQAASGGASREGGGRGRLGSSWAARQVEALQA